jgi:peptidoglycan hydrolase-like protein with peptidoglycan-binding domain
MIAIAAQSAALVPDSPDTQTEIDNMAREIVAFWQRNGIDVASASQFIGEEVKDRPGLAHHGDVQPWDRSDAWSRREDRWIFDSMLLQAIERHSGSAPAVPPVPTVPVPVPSQSVWRVGSTGDKVREIQKVVGVNQDGIYGPQTERAVIQWQKNLKVTPDGIWGPGTEQATYNLFVFLSNLPAVEQVSPDNSFLVALDAATKTVLRLGSNGGEVKILQVGLNAKGYGLVSDGVFGPATDRAVRQFQSNSGLQADGIVGPRTWAALLNN